MLADHEEIVEWRRNLPDEIRDDAAEWMLGRASRGRGGKLLAHLQKERAKKERAKKARAQAHWKRARIVVKGLAVVNAWRERTYAPEGEGAIAAIARLQAAVSPNM